MVTLRTSLAALTRLCARELLQFAVKLFDLPTHLVLFLNRVRARVAWTINPVTVRDHPFNVAICGNYLEQSYLERHLFELDYDTLSHLCLRPLYLSEMYVAPLFGEAHQPVALESGDEHQTQSYHQLEVAKGGVPTVEQHPLGLYSLVRDGVHQHISEVVVFALAVLLWCVDAVINRVVVARGPVSMQQVDYAYPPHQPTFRSTVLLTDQLNVVGVAFVLHRAVHDQVRLWAVIEQWLHQFPKLVRCTLGLCQVVRDRIMAHPLQMFSQVGAGVVGWRAD